MGSDSEIDTPFQKQKTLEEKQLDDERCVFT